MTVASGMRSSHEHVVQLGQVNRLDDVFVKAGLESEFAITLLTVAGDGNQTPQRIVDGLPNAVCCA